MSDKKSVFDQEEKPKSKAKAKVEYAYEGQYPNSKGINEDVKLTADDLDPAKDPLMESLLNAGLQLPMEYMRMPSVRAIYNYMQSAEKQARRDYEAFRKRNALPKRMSAKEYEEYRNPK